MGLAVAFTTIPEMFLALTSQNRGSGKPMLMKKFDGAYRNMTFDEVRMSVAHAVLAFQSLGLKRGDRIAILSENRPEWVITDMAALMMGIADVPLYPSQTAAQIAYILENAGVSAVFVSNQFQLSKVLKIRSEVSTLRHVIAFQDDVKEERGVSTFAALQSEGEKRLPGNQNVLEEHCKLVTPESLCTIIYTSGTTGNPKGVMLTHRNFVANIHGAADAIPIEGGDVMLSFLPLSHVFERMAGYYTALACGASIAYAESVETVAENLKEVHPTIVCCVPRLFERMHNRIARTVEKDSAIKRKIFFWAVSVGRKYVAARKHNDVGTVLGIQHGLAEKLVFSKLKERTGGRIRFFVSGGAALPRELGEFFEAVGILIIEGYGLTETSPVISANRLDKYKFGSVGMPLNNVEVKIAEDGEILTRGKHVMMGYYKDKKATDESIDKQGWLHTGDIGMLDRDGFLFITDRKKHLFVSSGGKNIAPQPIESMFSGADFIDQFVLIGDKRMFLTALIYPDYTFLREYADSHHIDYKTNADLANDPGIYRMIDERIQLTQKDLPNYERIRKFALLEQPLSIENGELTPTLKIKRKSVEERYRDLIEKMYHKLG